MRLEEKTKLNYVEEYNYCVSLGWYCGTASSLAKLGLRNFSGPFDWCHSHLESVITQIDNEFKDFMRKENLEINDKTLKTFDDKKYQFCFKHDMKESLELEYTDIYTKYNKRIKRFLENIKSPTCFFRAVRSEREIEYIINNTDYIESVLKRYNPKNSIVYILLNGMKSLPNNLSWFRLTLKGYSGDVYEMRTMFDHSKELLEFCNTVLCTEQIDSNIKYDLHKDGHRAGFYEVCYYLRNNIDGLDKKILNMIHLHTNEIFYIWGGGRGGIPLYYYLIKRGVNVKAIIDNRIREDFPDDIEFITPNDVEYYSKIFIAIKSVTSNFEIIDQIKEKKCQIFIYKELAVYKSMKENDNVRI